MKSTKYINGDVQVYYVLLTWLLPSSLKFSLKVDKLPDVRITLHILILFLLDQACRPRTFLCLQLSIKCKSSKYRTYLNIHKVSIIIVKKCLKIPKVQSEAVNQKGKEDTMAIRKGKDDTMAIRKGKEDTMAIRKGKEDTMAIRKGKEDTMAIRKGTQNDL